MAFHKQCCVVCLQMSVFVGIISSLVLSIHIVDLFYQEFLQFCMLLYLYTMDLIVLLLILHCNTQ